MSDPWLWMLLAKMAVAASVVAGCSLLAERSTPLLAAMIATLPISAGPVYVFLALQHDPAFIAAGSPGSVTSNLANSALLLVYVLTAQRFGTVVSLGSALVAWFALLIGLRLMQPPLPMLALATVVAFGSLHRVLRPYRDARSTAMARPPWYVLPLRAGSVALLAGAVTVLSDHVGPSWSGTLAALPIVLTSLIAILQPRIGGPAMAAVIAKTSLGLIGFGLGLASLGVTAVPLGSAAALGIGLALCVGWNLVLMVLGRRPRRLAP